METKDSILQSTSGFFYEKIIRLYPPSYLSKHREELTQNFEDLQKDIGSRKLFWAFIISDLIKSLGQQYMRYIKKHPLVQIILALLVLGVIFFGWQVLMLQKAHSTFENYAAFRDCAQITSRTDAQGTCITGAGQPITMVKFENKWFLQGDLPVCMISIGSRCLIDKP